MKDTYEFQAEINQLLSLIINTFYSDSEVAIRELIANSSDAIDKYRFGRDVHEEFDIKLALDEEHSILSIEDNGIGMTKTDLINNLGVIAKSGTKAFIENLKEKKIGMIGQFGVGFYSSFLIAHKVTVVTKHDDDVELEWESDASGSFSISTVENSSIQRGTRILLHLKQDSEFSNLGKIKAIIKKHANFITYPIKVQIEKLIDKEESDEENSDVNGSDVQVGTDQGEIDNKENHEGDTTDISGDGQSGVTVEDITKEPAVNKKSEKVQVKEWEVQNEIKPIWIRKKDDVSEDEYASFYKQLSNDWDSHLHKAHFHIEGAADLNGLLYIPKKPPPFDKEKKSRIKLYVKRVFVCELDKEFVPEWMQFVTGVIDSEDLPINISREMLQKSNTLTIIKKNIRKKIFDMIEDVLTNDGSDEIKIQFWSNYSKFIKLGIHENDKFKDKLLKLLRFNTTTHNFTSLDEYISRTPEDQKEVFYLVGENEKQLKSSPFIENLVSSGTEVALFSEPIDEYVMQSVREYESMKFVSCSKTHSCFKDQNENTDFSPLLEKIKTVLANNIENVVVSTRLENSPSCIVSGEFGWTANMQRIMNAQALGDHTMNSFMQPKKTMEINPSHSIIIKLNDTINSSDFEEDKVNGAINILYNTALLNSGFSIDNAQEFSNVLYLVLEQSLSSKTQTDTPTPACNAPSQIDECAPDTNAT